MNQNHRLHLFRQLLIQALFSCPECNGRGTIKEQLPFVIGGGLEYESKTCPKCNGSGTSDKPEAVGFNQLQQRVIDRQIRDCINPTWDDVPDFFAQLEAGEEAMDAKAEEYFNLSLRLELTEDEYSLEPVGLASWHAKVDEKKGFFPPLTEQETRVFLRSIARVLATEKILLPPEPIDPWKWPEKKVGKYDRKRIFWGEKSIGNNIPYNLWATRKLGRYVIAISRALLKAGRFTNKAEARQVGSWIAPATLGCLDRA